MSDSAGSSKLGDANNDPASPSAAGQEPVLSCAPSVAGLVPSKISATTIQCPSNYLPREGRSAVPVAGRFTSEQDVIEAFCVEAKSGQQTVFGEGTTGSVDAIDFEKSAVVAFAYDANTGSEPVLYRRGDELWLKVTQDDCRTTPELRSVAFIVPKSNKVGEQTCSRSCQ